LYDNILFINVDMYLGADHPYYRSVRMPVYIAERCDVTYLTVDVFSHSDVYIEQLTCSQPRINTMHHDRVNV
jgi:hypothetical protein